MMGGTGPVDIDATRFEDSIWPETFRRPNVVTRLPPSKYSSNLQFKVATAQFGGATSTKP